MVIRTKHIAFSLALFGFVTFLFWLNWSWGNSVEKSLWLSLYSFLMIFMAFNLYWEIRDFWQYRWSKTDTLNVKINSIQIPIVWELHDRNTNPSKYIFSDILHSPTPIPNSPLIIFTHGFSDDRIFTRFYTIPLALAGYDVVTYDCRGTKKSRNVGNKNQFIEIVNDLGDIIDFVSNYHEFKNREIILVGISLGAMASIKQGLEKKVVKRTIAIASMGNYRENMVNSPVPFKSKWWIWLRFKLFGVIFNPYNEQNYILSPTLQLQKLKQNYSTESEWKQFINNKLYLFHARNDHIIPLSNFYMNLEVSNLSYNNWIITRRGGHTFRKYEPIIVAAIINALK